MYLILLPEDFAHLLQHVTYTTFDKGFGRMIRACALVMLKGTRDFPADVNRGTKRLMLWG